MAWTDDKSNGDEYTPEEYTAMKNDQLNRLHKDGSVKFTGDQDADAHTVKNLSSPVNANDAARKADLPTNHSDLADDEAAKHRLISDSGTGGTDLWSASKIGTELSGKSPTSHNHNLAGLSEKSYASLTSVPNRSVVVAVTAPDGDLATGDSKAIFTVPAALNGMNLVSARATVETVGSSSTTVQIRNVTDSHDMLSSVITIAASAHAGGGTVNTTYDDVATDDRLAVDVDSAGTGAKGLNVVLEFQKP